MTSEPDDDPAGADDCPEPIPPDPVARMLAESIARIDRNLAHVDGLLQTLADARPPK